LEKNHHNNTGICWQYLIKQKKAKAKNKTQFNYKGFIPEVKEIEISIAKQFILEYEWLGNMGSANYYYGLFFGNHLASVVCFSNSVSPKAYTNLLGIKHNEILLLCRGATAHWAPDWAPSKLISKTLKLIKNKYNIKVVVAYADPEAGEIGYIYQASNFYYWGLTNPGGSKKYKINGEIMHSRKVHRLFGTRKAEVLKKIDKNYSAIATFPKHRYIYFTCNSYTKKLLMEKIKNLIKPYPKKDK